MNSSQKIIYLDCAAATPLHPLAKKAMEPFLTLTYGNPSSLHYKGVEARNAIETARKTLAQIVGARAEEIIFTSGGTESCNLAILGLTSTFSRGHIITTTIEHHAALEPILELKTQGFLVTNLPANPAGIIDVKTLEKAIRKDTVFVSIMYANNEIGSIQPILEIGKLLSRVNAQRQKQGLGQILFHTDACQTAGVLDINVNHLQVDLMSVAASKFYGPKGAGFLYVRKGTFVHPIIHGGGQERGIRSGTENVAGIVGMARALELATGSQALENKRLTVLRDYLIHQIKKIWPKAILNGPGVYPKIHNYSYNRRLPNNINFTFPRVEGEALMFYLDAKGICVSTGSACATGSTDASHVLRAIGRTEKQAKESIRVTLGKSTKKSDLDYLLKAIKQSILLILDGR